MRYLYDLGMRLYGLSVFIATLFNKKARSWYRGRAMWRADIAKSLARPAEYTFWMHAASLGEFEQGRPLLEAYRAANPEHRIVLSFFSPSGYEVRKDYEGADLVCYLPLDTCSNARDFIEIVRPDVAVFIKYEFWFNHLAVLREHQVPTYLVSGRIHAGQTFFKSWGAWFRNGLDTFTHFFVLDHSSVDLLHGIGYDNASLAGDTRFDRVLEVVAEDREIQSVADFVADAPTLIIGSSWPQEELLVKQFMASHPDVAFKLIIAPHEVDDSRLTEISESFGDVLLYSDLLDGSVTVSGQRILLIDTIGLLSTVYRYAQLAIIGGGFGSGVHNVLEAAAWGVPVVIGPRHKRFPEVLGLIEAGGAFAVEDQRSVDTVLEHLLSVPRASQEAGGIGRRFCENNAGATKTILAHLPSNEK